MSKTETGRGQGWRKIEGSDDEILERYRRWIFKVANEMCGSKPWLIDDLAQEGHIAMWKALKTFDESKGTLPHWLTKCARWRMGEVLRRRELWTGTDNQRGHERFDPPIAVDPQSATYIDAITDGAEIIDKVLSRYHDGDISRALDELTEQQRDYVIRRFWNDESYTDLFMHFRKNPSDLWKTAKPKLAKELAHLASQ